MHEHLLSELERQILVARKKGTGSRMVQAAPRGHAKSTLTTLILPLWCVAARHRRFIGILSDTSEQAGDFLETVKAELLANERLQEDFPQACGRGRNWKIGRIETANGVRLIGWGKRKRLRGARFINRRPDLIICDDLEDDENIDSPEQREKDRRWFFKAVMKIGGKYTVYVVIGTLLHYDSLLARLLKQPGWTGKKWRAVIRWSTSPCWQTWEKIYADAGNPEAEPQADAYFENHREEMLAETEVLWPEVESYYYLMKMRVSDGPAYFDSEKQNEPIHPEDCLFREEWFAYWDDAASATPAAGTIVLAPSTLPWAMAVRTPRRSSSARFGKAARGQGHEDQFAGADRAYSGGPEENSERHLKSARFRRGGFLRPRQRAASESQGKSSDGGSEGVMSLFCLYRFSMRPGGSVTRTYKKAIGSS